MAVGVGVDQAGNDQAAAGVDDFGIGVPRCPGATMSAMTSASTTMSRGSPRAVETECTNLPVITSMATVPLAGQVARKMSLSLSKPA
jgi:hypothetical protein